MRAKAVSSKYWAAFLASIAIVADMPMAQAGLADYRIATWNMQGASATTENKWRTHVGPLMTENDGLNVLAIQEAGARPASAKKGRTWTIPGNPSREVTEYEWEVGTRFRKKTFYIYHADIDASAHRVNLATVTSFKADEVIIIPPPIPASRPVIGIRKDTVIGTTTKSDYFFNAHALSNGGNDAGEILYRVHQRFQLNNDSASEFMVLGDFNRTPEKLAQQLTNNSKYQSAKNDFELLVQRDLTQASGHQLDYAAVGKYLNPSASNSNRLRASKFMIQRSARQGSDHYPVKFRKNC